MVTVVSTHDTRTPRSSAAVRGLSRSLHWRALQIDANSQGTRVELLQFSDRSIKIELTDVTDNQSPNARVVGDLTNDRR